VIVMPSNNTGFDAGYLAGAYQGRFGHLFSPAGWRKPRWGLPYALDNGAFARWDEAAFVNMVQTVAGLVTTRTIVNPPLWVIVPDVVADRAATLERWREWAPKLKPFGWPLAFAVQDGMTQDDVPNDAEVIFVGGSTDWKWRTVWDWTRHNRRVHVGRVNGYEWLWRCHEAGVESCDGTGWFRGRLEQLLGLKQYLDEASTNGRPQERLCG
jgi:hypothetical protein